MFRSGLFALRCWVAASVLLSVSLFPADEPKETVPAAPIPAQITNGKTAFIANTGVNVYTLPAYITSHTGAPTGLYDEFYAAIKNWGK
jgi:hypothetical protein